MSVIPVTAGAEAPTSRGSARAVVNMVRKLMVVNRLRTVRIGETSGLPQFRKLGGAARCRARDSKGRIKTQDEQPGLPCSSLFCLESSLAVVVPGTAFSRATSAGSSRNVGSCENRPATADGSGAAACSPCQSR